MFHLKNSKEVKDAVQRLKELKKKKYLESLKNNCLVYEDSCNIKQNKEICFIKTKNI